eukprot:1315178-Amphidinium_carterae.1
MATNPSYPLAPWPGAVICTGVHAAPPKQRQQCAMAQQVYPGGLSTVSYAAPSSPSSLTSVAGSSVQYSSNAAPGVR